MLATEDTLRLNVLLANQPLAIRINESTMAVHALTARGEAEIKLHPDCRDDLYVKRVKEMLSGHVLGSPGGYPVYLQRWTRMGQMRDQSLEQLLLLGEPEAVVAAVCAPGLTDELARRAWWVMEDSENARRMLHREAVLTGRMGPVLASYLAEHLPFESEADKMIETVRLVLQPGLVDDAVRDDLWRKAARRNAYYVGFLAALPDALPLDAPAHPLAAALPPAPASPPARLLTRALSAAGQAYLDTVRTVLDKPTNQDVVNSLLDCVAGYFSAVRPEGPPDATIEALETEATAFLEGLGGELGDVVAATPALRELVGAMRVLSGLSYGVVRPVFGDSTAIGSLMRRKLEPVFVPLRRHIDRLRGGRR